MGGTFGGGASHNTYGDFPTFGGSGFDAGSYAALRYNTGSFFAGPEIHGGYSNIKGMSPQTAFIDGRWNVSEGVQVGTTFNLPDSRRANVYGGGGFRQAFFEGGVVLDNEFMHYTLTGGTVHGGLEVQLAPASMLNVYGSVDLRYSQVSGNVNGDDIKVGSFVVSGVISVQFAVK